MSVSFFEGSSVGASLGADGVLEVVLRRWSRGNAFDASMAHQLESVFFKADAAAEVKGVLLHGGDSPHFCVGADLTLASSSSSSSSTSALSSSRDLGGVASLAIWHCRKPVVAAIHGAAVGIGITMTLPCDIRVVEEDATIGFIFAKRGLSVEAASSYFLPRLVGHAKAIELCLRARKFKPRQEPALFTDIVPKGHSRLRGLEILREILSNSSLPSLVYIKRCLNSAVAASGPHQAHELETKVLNECYQSQEVVEGFMSFLEKRPPQFRSSGNDASPFLDVWTQWPQRYPSKL